MKTRRVSVRAVEQELKPTAGRRATIVGGGGETRTPLRRSRAPSMRPAALPAAVAPRGEPALVRRRRWERLHRRRLAATDAIIVAGAAATTELLAPGSILA